MDRNEIVSAIVLNSLEGIGPKEIKILMEVFHSAQGVVLAGPLAWESVVGFSKELISLIAKLIPKAMESAEKEFEAAQEKGIRITVPSGEGYPPLLREIHDPPPIIYIWGEGAFWEKPAIALVGSRRCSYYGEKVAKELARDLALAGIVTVSGLARGIDSAIHRETVAQGETTWAVLGSGLLEIYPPENQRLAESIRERGALISEFPLRMQPLPYNFPRRNRIISGLSQGCVIIEGDQKSGALITCRLAADQGKEVFAVPGSIHSALSRGPNFFIKNGAKLIENVQDIFDELPHLRSEKSIVNGMGHEKKDLHLHPIYENILSFIEAEPVHKDILLEKMGCPVSELATILLEMEMKCLVRNLPGGFVARV